MSDVPAYLIRSGYSFAVVRVTGVRSETRQRPSEEGPQPSLTTTIDLAVVEPWYGPTYGDALEVNLDEPVSETTRLRFPHPYWGYAPREVGALLLFWLQAPAEPPATRERAPDVSQRPFGLVRYDANDPELQAVRDLFRAELAGAADPPRDRRAREAVYLGAASPSVRRFGVHALASDELGPDDEARAASALARALMAEKSDPIRVEIASVVGGVPYRTTTPAGRAAIVGALLLGAGDASEDMRRSCLDALSELEPLELDGLPAIRSAPAREAIEERILEETDEASNSKLQALLGKVTG